MSREAPDQLVLRVGSKGLVRELETRTLPVKHRTGAPWALVSVGVPVLGIGALASALDSSFFGGGSAFGPATMLLGGASVAVGVGLFVRPPKEMQVRCAVFTAKVDVTLTWHSPLEGVAPVGLDGAGWARASDEDAPCTGKMSRLKRQM